MTGETTRYDGASARIAAGQTQVSVIPASPAPVDRYIEIYKERIADGCRPAVFPSELVALTATHLSGDDVCLIEALLSSEATRKTQTNAVLSTDEATQKKRIQSFLRLVIDNYQNPALRDLMGRYLVLFFENVNKSLIHFYAEISKLFLGCPADFDRFVTFALPHMPTSSTTVATPATPTQAIDQSQLAPPECIEIMRPEDLLEKNLSFLPIGLFQALIERPDKWLRIRQIPIQSLEEPPPYSQLLPHCRVPYLEIGYIFRPNKAVVDEDIRLFLKKCCCDAFKIFPAWEKTHIAGHMGLTAFLRIRLVIALGDKFTWHDLLLSLSNRELNISITINSTRNVGSAQNPDPSLPRLELNLNHPLIIDKLMQDIMKAKGGLDIESLLINGNKYVLAEFSTGRKIGIESLTSPAQTEGKTRHPSIVSAAPAAGAGAGAEVENAWEDDALLNCLLLPEAEQRRKQIWSFLSDFRVMCRKVESFLRLIIKNYQNPAQRDQVVKYLVLFFENVMSGDIFKKFSGYMPLIFDRLFENRPLEFDRFMAFLLPHMSLRNKLLLTEFGFRRPGNRPEEEPFLFSPPLLQALLRTPFIDLALHNLPILSIHEPPPHHQLLPESNVQNLRLTYVLRLKEAVPVENIYLFIKKCSFGALKVMLETKHLCAVKMDLQVELGDKMAFYSLSIGMIDKPESGKKSIEVSLKEYPGGRLSEGEILLDSNLLIDYILSNRGALEIDILSLTNKSTTRVYDVETYKGPRHLSLPLTYAWQESQGLQAQKEAEEAVSPIADAKEAGVVGFARSQVYIRGSQGEPIPAFIDYPTVQSASQLVAAKPQASGRKHLILVAALVAVAVIVRIASTRFG